MFCYWQKKNQVQRQRREKFLTKNYGPNIQSGYLVIQALERRARSINTSNVDTNEEDGVEQPREVRPPLRLLNDHSDSEEANLEKKNTEKEHQETASKNASDIFKICVLNASVAVTSQPPNKITTIPLSQVNMHVPSPSPMPNTYVHSFTHMPPPAVTSQQPHNITNFNHGLVNSHVPSSAPFPYIATTSQQPSYTPLVNAHVSGSVPLPYTAEPLHHYPNQHDKQVSASNSYVPSVLPSGSHSFVSPFLMSTYSQQSSYMHVDTSTSRPVIMSNNDIPASNNSTSTSTNPLSNFTELTDLQPIDSLHSNNNCADCIMKDKQMQLINVVMRIVLPVHLSISLMQPYVCIYDL
ncbi:unnamed protein product [Mytilus edulis]|uniref:Uncharacterized protein n=1 Tax=Mytilus edulis TaxID=6550 RepID=A0A8S3PX49_MYTED|nr:unnamed protein product [Mytilus edulis]